MNRLHPPLPAFPAVPTAPMSRGTKRHLLEALQECHKTKSWKETQDHIQHGYALLWLHLVLERGLDPRKVVGAALRGNQDLLSPFFAEASRLGLHSRVALGCAAPVVAATAARLWREAKEAQASVLPQLPGLGLDLVLLTPVNPAERPVVMPRRYQ